jgi:hypothetical protein
MKVVINNCFGGFSLSHVAIMRYAELSGFKLYPFVEKRDENGNIDFSNKSFIPYDGNGDVFIIHYSKEPLNKDGSYKEGAYWSDRDINRTDENLIKVVKELSNKANGRCAQLKIITVPDEVQWEIDEYDGLESIHETHRVWR